MRHLRWQALIALLGLALVGGLLAGQGGSTSNPLTPDQPSPGGVYTEAIVGTPQRFNPLLDYFNLAERDVNRLVFSGLTRFDASGQPAPDLANWIITGDITYTFVLRAHAQWHDGTPVTTEDVAFTIGVLQDPAYPGPADIGRLWRAVQTRIINTQTIEIILPEPFAPFLDYTTFGLLPQHLLLGTAATDLAGADFNAHPIGTGPFKFESAERNGNALTAVTLSAFPNYFATQPLLSQVKFFFYPDVATAFAAYEQGQVLGVSHLDAERVQLALNQPRLGLYTSVLPEYSLIFLNLKDDSLIFFKEKKVRQALLLGLNRPAMVANLLHGQAVVANAPVLPSSWAYNESLSTARYDPDTANVLLDSAGWVFPEGALVGTSNYVRQKGGTPFKFTLTVPDDPLHLALAEAAQTSWAALGIQVELAPVPATDLRSQYLEPRTFQAMLVDFNFSRTPDPDPYPLWHETQAESGQNYSGFADRVMSEYLEQARITTDISTRARLYRNFQARFADQVPALLLYYPVYNYGVDTSIQAVQAGALTEPSDRLNGITQWFVQVGKAP